MDNQFLTAFLAHPERFFVLDDAGTMVMKGQPIEGGYNLADLESCLNSDLPARS
eukprot:m.443757 g.443757  ORF g.443757 m.443757 type:complete len:54 (+) comp19005_c0_seq1:1590-1751(+)